MEIFGNNTFKCTYTPEDTANYNIVKGIDVTIRVTEKLTVNIENYTTKVIEGTNAIYINGITPETTLEKMKTNIKTNGNIQIYESDGTLVEGNNEIAKTGMKMEIKTQAENVTYVICIMGDNNGDGETNSIDLLKFARYLVGLDKNLENEYLYACDVYQDGKFNNMDLLKIARVIVGLEKI